MSGRTKRIVRLTVFGLITLTIGLTVGIRALRQINVCPARELPITFDGVWTTGAPMPTPRSEIAAAALDGRIYVAGGLALEPFPTTTAFEVYDPATDTWETRAALPIPLHHTSIAAYGGKIYLAGGYTDPSFEPTNQAFVYDPESDSWSPTAPIPMATGAHMLVSLEAGIAFVGGAPGGTTLWLYNPAADSWNTDLEQMPTPREHLGAAAFEGHLIVVGGRQPSNLETVEIYDPQTDTWTQGLPMPTARGGFSVATANRMIFAGGGEDFVSVVQSCTFNRAEVYDPTADTWERLPDMPTPRHGITSVGLDGKWFVIGGATGAAGATFNTTTDLIEIFTPAA